MYVIGKLIPHCQIQKNLLYFRPAMLPFLTILLLAAPALAIRCYQCRSDEQPDCGEPFNNNNVYYSECDNFFTKDTFMCFKAKQYGAGHWFIIRGCAPFTSEVFGPKLRGSMAGDYWRGSNLFSFCDSDRCNGGWFANSSLPSSLPSLKVLALTLAFILLR